MCSSSGCIASPCHPGSVGVAGAVPLTAFAVFKMTCFVVGKLLVVFSTRAWFPVGRSGSRGTCCSPQCSCPGYREWGMRFGALTGPRIWGCPGSRHSIFCLPTLFSSIFWSPCTRSRSLGTCSGFQKCRDMCERDPLCRHIAYWGKCRPKLLFGCRDHRFRYWK